MLHPDAVPRVRHGGGPGRVGADEVAGHQGVGGQGKLVADLDPLPVVAADDVRPVFCQVARYSAGKGKALFPGLARTNDGDGFTFKNAQISSVEKYRRCLFALERCSEQLRIVGIEYRQDVNMVVS